MSEADIWLAVGVCREKILVRKERFGGGVFEGGERPIAEVPAGLSIVDLLKDDTMAG